MTVEQIIRQGRQLGCSDIHITEGEGIRMRLDGELREQRAEGEGADPFQMRSLILSMLDKEEAGRLEAGEDIDLAVETPDGCRQRVNVFRQQGKLAATIRLLNGRIPSLKELGLPPVLQQLALEPRGLILVTGPTGSGKSTTLASMIDYRSSLRAEHIITIEDPVEYVYESKRALIHQREVGRDTGGFHTALRSALREDPDVILVGEMRDYETISAALTAAETGHLVLSTLHTTGAALTVDRIIDACPVSGQNQIRAQLAGVMRGVITQCLIRRADRTGRVAATEVLIGTDAAANLIREGKGHQLATVMQSGMAVGMHTLNQDLTRLCTGGLITREAAYYCSNNRAELANYL